MTLMNTLVFTIFSYGSESWTMKSTERCRIDALEMWCWRRMLQIPWTAYRTSVSILNELGIRERILRYFGHITQREHNNLERLIVQGKMEGRTPRGKSPSRWIDQIREITGETLQTILRDAE